MTDEFVERALDILCGVVFFLPAFITALFVFLSGAFARGYPVRSHDGWLD